MIQFPALGQQMVPLWPDRIPNQVDSNEEEFQGDRDILWLENVQNPSLEVYLPTQRTATGKGVIICPGGGYQGLAYDWEGRDFAKWLNTLGIAAFVLKYRLPVSKSLLIAHQAPLQDAMRAMRLVRHQADAWNLLPDQIGIMGFSAGGHLAATLGTRFQEPIGNPIDSVDAFSARPDFMILVYPVITMRDPYTHVGSRKNLLGDNPSEKLVEFYSNELHVELDTPPTFILHATDDPDVSVMNSLKFYEALVGHGVYTEMHLFPKGKHGFALGLQQGHVKSWVNLLADWIFSLEKQQRPTKTKDK